MQVDLATILTIQYLNRNDFYLGLENIGHNLTGGGRLHFCSVSVGSIKPTFLHGKLILQDPINCSLF